LRVAFPAIRERTYIPRSHVVAPGVSGGCGWMASPLVERLLVSLCCHASTRISVQPRSPCGRPASSNDKWFPMTGDRLTPSASDVASPRMSVKWWSRLLDRFSDSSTVWSTPLCRTRWTRGPSGGRQRQLQWLDAARDGGSSARRSPASLPAAVRAGSVTSHTRSSSMPPRPLRNRGRTRAP
jgi:hypothetical protein